MLDNKYELRDGRVDPRHFKNQDVENYISTMSLKNILSYNVIIRSNLLNYAINNKDTMEAIFK